MKSNVYIIHAILLSPRCLALWALITLLIPNIALDITETSTAAWKIANIALPAGIYLLLLACTRRTAVMVLVLIPMMVLAAFQLVLIYLYGESIIAVDMYLNVVTTSMSEATELLGNLIPAIVLVVLLYLPPIAWAIYQLVKKSEIARSTRREMAVWGASMAVFGAILGFIASSGHSSFRKEIFPANVIVNLFEAIDRTRQIAAYPETSAHYTFHARSIRHPREREIYVFVIGETSRALDWQLSGYSRPTNPRLSAEPNVVFFPRALSESNTTHKSVPMIMSCVSSERFDDVNRSKSIITAMKEAGFYTRFFSNQPPNRSYTEYFGNEADDTRYTATDAHPHPYDEELLTMLNDAVADTVHPKQFVVLHTYGSHFSYKDRYPREFARFLPDTPDEASEANRSRLVNAYDNSILYTDHILASVIDLLRSARCPSAMLYSADHGEDIYDDARGRFLHASPTPTYYQLHVAMLAWLSDEFAERHPHMLQSLRANAHRCVSPQKSMSNTALDLCGVDTPLADHTKSLAGASYTYADPVYITDLNAAVPLAESGIKAADIQLLARVLGNSVSNSQLAYSDNHQSAKFSKTKTHHSNNQLFKISTPAESFPK